MCLGTHGITPFKSERDRNFIHTRMEGFLLTVEETVEVEPVAAPAPRRRAPRTRTVKPAAAESPVDVTSAVEPAATLQPPGENQEAGREEATEIMISAPAVVRAEPEPDGAAEVRAEPEPFSSKEIAAAVNAVVVESGPGPSEHSSVASIGRRTSGYRTIGGRTIDRGPGSRFFAPGRVGGGSGSRRASNRAKSRWPD